MLVGRMTGVNCKLFLRQRLKVGRVEESLTSPGLTVTIIFDTLNKLQTYNFIFTCDTRYNTFVAMVISITLESREIW